MFAVREKSISFGISAVTIEVSSCTKFQIHRGSVVEPRWGRITHPEN